MPDENDLIFVSIAAYRDPQLTPTVLDCLAKAKWPERLRFGICWQRDAADAALPFQDDARFGILDVDWRESQGACWARAEVMQLWHGEDWFLQLDSHCRFAPAWDATLLRMAEETASAKPILTTYATPFTPGDDEVLEGGPLQMAFQGFTAEGIPQLRPAGFPQQRASMRPVRSRFVAAGFLFAPGRFVEDVPYDPALYFMGEESALTVRAFTHGYDFFHPAETVVWHDYIRADARKHWGDHTDAEAEAKTVTARWSELDERSRRKVQRLLLGEDVGAFGLGTARTLTEYEAYAGLSFRLRKAQQYTVRGLEPPNPEAAADWPEHVYPWIARIRAEVAMLPAGALHDPTLWSVSVIDSEGFEVHRRDFTAEELAPIAAVGEAKDFALVCEFASETVPARWTILPLSRSRGWLRVVHGQFAEEDFAILREDEGESD